MTPTFAAALILHLLNFSGAPAAMVHQAQDEVTRVYAEIGVPVAWSSAADTTDTGHSAIRIILLASEGGVLRRADKPVMGAAMRTRDGNAVAYVFYRRVRAEADRYDVSTGLVLACAIAHEIGHLLLPGPTHAADGLMRATWSGNEFHRAEQRRLTFLPDDVARIQAGLR